MADQDLEQYAQDSWPEPEVLEERRARPRRQCSNGVLSSWRGFVEIGLRASSLVFPVLTFLTSAVVLGEISKLSGDFRATIDDSNEHHRSDSRVPDTPNLVSLSRGESGFLIFLALLVVIYEVLVIGLRIFNTSTTNITTFFVIDVIVTGALAFVSLVTGGVAAHYSAQWDEWAGYIDRFPEGVQSLYSPDHVKTIRNTLGATAAFCILAVAVYVCGAVWSVVMWWPLRARRREEYSDLT